MVGSDGQHQQKMTCEMAGFEHHFNVDIKKLIREDYPVAKCPKPAPLGEKVAALQGQEGRRGIRGYPRRHARGQPRKG